VEASGGPDAVQQDIFLYLERMDVPLTQSEIIIADPDLSPPSLLIEEAEVA
jgi:hypothetical protein